MTKSWIILIVIVLLGVLAVKLRRAPSGVRLRTKPLSGDPALAKNALMEECKQALIPQAGAKRARAFPLKDLPWADGEGLFMRSFVCEALAKKNPAACSDLDKIQWLTKEKEALSPGLDCRVAYFEKMAMASGVSGKHEEAVALCEEFIANHPGLSKAALHKLCLRAVAAYEQRNAGEFCDQAAQALKLDISAQEFLKACRKDLRGLGGPEECAKIPAENLRDRTRCFDTSTILSASAAQDPAVCHGSELCEALMTSSETICHSLREKAVNMACTTAVQDEIRKRFLTQEPSDPTANP